ncbi:DUF5610 domain-containing protein [Glaciecola sp. MH2013]|uniref:DUF5610 domain-containing protein n=1 Tax=Glaciecola sp. MH2013 TaxID=2785524 RepID=UPI0018A1036C|nr:DUF5610 domain-containing protein [Glaciecola sp. MH2013]MBF7074963.1 DUF5610 domain-containing protein [Glaciecola sp. MH2013]
MNIVEVKTYQGEKQQVVRPDEVLNKKLQQDGLQQARELQQSFIAPNESISDGRSIAARVLGGAINDALELREESEEGSEKNPKSKATDNTQLFDFEEVAKNVLNFVGGVINKAASSGSSDEKLNSLFEQARFGVDKGIALARQELSNSINDDIEKGINASRDTIFDGIDKLENNIFPVAEDEQIGLNTALEAKRSELSEFYVRTRDGDEVTIQFGLSQSLDSRSFISTESGVSNTILKESQSFSLAISGELDDEELKAIGDLVAQADDIANSFYRGDIEKAFEDSLNVGFDNKELASFAFQLTQAESYQKVQKYGEIQQYSNDDTDLKAPKAVAQYLNKLLDGLDQAQETLESQGDFKSVINSLVNELKDVQVPDILTAINRFHSFNAKLLEGIEPKPDY